MLVEECDENRFSFPEEAIENRETIVDAGQQMRTLIRTARGYLYLSGAFLAVGGMIALLMRWHLGIPENTLPIELLGTILPEAVISSGRLMPGGYGALFTMHGTIMMYYGLIPALIGYGGYGIMMRELDRSVGVMRGAPRFGLVAIALSGVAMITSFFVEGGPASFGWTAYAPLSTEQGYTGVGLGADVWIVSLIIYAAGLFTISVDLAATWITSRTKSGLREGGSVGWNITISTLLLIITLPVISVGLLLLLSDRTLETSFFIPEGLEISGELLGRAGGGEPLLWQHLFWYFGHPLVYVLILPVMGAVSEILPHYAGRPLDGPRTMKFASAAIAILGLLVWGHHMFQTELNPLLRSGFVMATLLIAVPSTLKVYHWVRTLFGGKVVLEVPMLFSLGFLALFVIGGLSGLMLASTPVDMYLHDSYFVVAHIHYVLFGGSILGFFAALYHWSSIGQGNPARRLLAKIHFWGTFIGVNLVFFPMHFLGTGGYPRRLFDASGYDYLRGFEAINSFMTYGALLLGLAQLTFLLLVLLYWKRSNRADQEQDINFNAREENGRDE